MIKFSTKQHGSHPQAHSKTTVDRFSTILGDTTNTI